MTSIVYYLFIGDSTNLQRIEFYGNKINCEEAFPDVEEEEQVNIVVTEEYVQQSHKYCEFKTINTITDTSNSDNNDYSNPKPEPLECAQNLYTPTITMTCKKSLLKKKYQSYCNQNEE